MTTKRTMMKKMTSRLSLYLCCVVGSSTHATLLFFFFTAPILSFILNQTGMWSPGKVLVSFVSLQNKKKILSLFNSSCKSFVRPSQVPLPLMCRGVVMYPDDQHVMCVCVCEEEKGRTTGGPLQYMFYTFVFDLVLPESYFFIDLLG